MNASPVLYSVDGAVATITLNRPTVLNALSSELLVALNEAFRSARDDAHVRAVVLTAAGRGFSAGADLSAGGADQQTDPGMTLRTYYHPLILGMRTLAKPIVTAVNGLAAGAGMSIALAGDIVLAARSAYFLQAFSRIGLVPDAGSTWFLPRLVGDSRARAMAILADRIPAEDAERWGLVWKVLDDDQLLAEAQRMAAHLASQPTRAYALIKQAMHASQDNDLAAQLELEAVLQSEAAGTADFKEGVQAFLEKRAPKFTGR